MWDPWWKLTPVLPDGMSQMPVCLSQSAQSPLCPRAGKFHDPLAAMTTLIQLWGLEHTQYLATPCTHCSVPNCSTLQHSQQQHVACVQAGMNTGDVFVRILYKHILPCGSILSWHLLGIYQVIQNAEGAFLQTRLACHAVSSKSHLRPVQLLDCSSCLLRILKLHNAPSLQSDNKAPGSMGYIGHTGSTHCMTVQSASWLGVI